MPCYDNIGGTLHTVSDIYDNVDGALREVSKGYDNIDGTLREYHSLLKVEDISHIEVMMNPLETIAGSGAITINTSPSVIDTSSKSLELWQDAVFQNESWEARWVGDAYVVLTDGSRVSINSSELSHLGLRVSMDINMELNSTDYINMAVFGISLSGGDFYAGLVYFPYNTVNHMYGNDIEYYINMSRLDTMWIIFTISSFTDVNNTQIPFYIDNLM